MSKEEKLFCDRCKKEIKHYFYVSDIDGKHICESCSKAEEPKELAKQLAELKAENERLKIENIAINQVAEYVGKIGENETALEEYNTSQQNKILMFNNKRLLQQLKEKDEEITELKKYKSQTISFTPKLVSNAKLVAETIENDKVGIDTLSSIKSNNTKQVCEKIREELEKLIVLMGDDTHSFKQEAVYWQDITAILEKAKGETNAENGD